MNLIVSISKGFSSGLAAMNLPAMHEIWQVLVGSIPGSGRSPWRRKWQPTPVFLRNPMDRGSWWATVYGVAKSWTRLSD